MKRLTYANVMSTLALFIALGGVSYAAVKLPSNSVGTPQIRNGAVTGSKIDDGAVSEKNLDKALVAKLTLAGKPGPQGVQGIQGVAGAGGAAGAIGAQGLRGVAGADGAAGAIGAQGLQGVAGDPAYVQRTAYQPTGTNPPGGMTDVVSQQFTVRAAGAYDLGVHADLALSCPAGGAPCASGTAYYLDGQPVEHSYTVFTGSAGSSVGCSDHISSTIFKEAFPIVLTPGVHVLSLRVRADSGPDVGMAACAGTKTFFLDGPYSVYTP